VGEKEGKQGGKSEQPGHDGRLETGVSTDVNLHKERRLSRGEVVPYLLASSVGVPWAFRMGGAARPKGLGDCRAGKREEVKKKTKAVGESS